MEIARDIEIFDYLGNRWVCSIYNNDDYRNAPSFMRLRCRRLGFDKILESLNNDQTLIKVLKFITFYNYSAVEVGKDPIKMDADAIIHISDEPVL
ncbi:hypothetical protein [Macrococcus equipercicus]|uniref:Uncharacterized protein n=1 Tax=Macrococcus equipercicus TaxID=69967 RepID=A0A9Q9BQ55_9STAP|nr:hypothetical protein [Macrococcus equipercicus]KAA1039330.1 hypothetical protein ERX35_007090 [Macrococcus equipercicus]UTH13621.1 hypothetical protein KFV11_10420 [Macrococcus equipercicus]